VAQWQPARDSIPHPFTTHVFRKLDIPTRAELPAMLSASVADLVPTDAHVPSGG